MREHFFQKTGQDLLKGNLVYMKLPLDIKGMYWDLRMMVDDQTWKDGSFPLGAAKRATVNDLVLFYSDGTKAKGNYVRKCIDRLKAAGVVKTRRTSHAKDVVILATFMDEQDLGNPDALRKRQRAEELLTVLVDQSVILLKDMFLQTKAELLSYDMLKEHLAKRLVKPSGKGITRVTAEKLLSNLTKRGVLMFDEAGLGKLAAPPESGPESGSVGTGSWAKYSGARNIPVELEPELEPEIERDTYVSPVDSAGQLGRSPVGSSNATGATTPGGGEASAARRSDSGRDAM